MTRKANEPTLDTGKPNFCWKERILSSSSPSLLSSRVRACVTANDGPLRAFFPKALSLRAALYYSTMNCHKMRRRKLYKSQNQRPSPWTQWLCWLVRKGESKVAPQAAGLFSICHDLTEWVIDMMMIYGLRAGVLVRKS